MSNVYFTSDLHLGHKMAAEMRGFNGDIHKHDNHIINILKGTLTKRDVLWILGDVAMQRDSLRRMHEVPCYKRLVMGNHDKFQTDEYRKVFRSLHGMVNKYGWWLTHTPMHPQEVHRREANIHGHIHKHGETGNLGTPYINVNWDFWDRPLSLKELQDAVRQFS